MRFVLLVFALSTACDRCDQSEACKTGAPLTPIQGIWTIEGNGDRAGCIDARYNGSFELGPSAKLAIDAVIDSLYDAGFSKVDQAQGRDGVLGSDGRYPEAGALTPDGNAAKDQGVGGQQRDFSRPGDFYAYVDPPHPPLTQDAARDAFTNDVGEILIKDIGIAKDVTVKIDNPNTKPPVTANIQNLHLHEGPNGFSLTGRAQGTCVTFETREEINQGGTIIYQFKGTISSDARKISGTFFGEGPVGCKAGGNFEVTIR